MILPLVVGDGGWAAVGGDQLRLLRGRRRGGERASPRLRHPRHGQGGAPSRQGHRHLL